MTNTMKMTMKFSGEVRVGPGNVMVEKNWPLRSTTEIRTEELVESVRGALQQNGVRGVMVNVYPVDKFGSACTRAEHLELRLGFPNQVSVYKGNLVLSQGMQTNEVPLNLLKKPVLNLLSKYNLGAAVAHRFKVSTSGVQEGVEIEL